MEQEEPAADQASQGVHSEEPSGGASPDVALEVPSALDVEPT